MASDGLGTTTYLVAVRRLEPLQVTLDSSATIPVTAAGYTAGGNTVHLSLGHAPATGTHFKLIDNTGFDLIRGRFSNLAHGQVITLPFNNASYKFAANYFGGDGNDLVRQWAGTKAYAWGSGGAGQTGTGESRNLSVPTPVTATGVLAGKTITSVATGSGHSLALCSDGTLAAWGYNLHGQLGNYSIIDSAVPVDSASWYFAGKEITAIAAGFDFSVVACSDGTLAAWGNNRSGQLGSGSTSSSASPQPVNTVGVLAGSRIPFRQDTGRPPGRLVSLFDRVLGRDSRRMGQQRKRPTRNRQQRLGQLRTGRRHDPGFPDRKDLGFAPCGRQP